MAIIKTTEGNRSLVQRGKIGNYSEFGKVYYGHAQYGVSFENAGIYQMRTLLVGERKIDGPRKYHKGPIIMKFYQPTGEPHAGQIAQRAKLEPAIVAYRELTAEQKEVYYQRAVGRKFSGYNLFLSEYMTSH